MENKVKDIIIKSLEEAGHDIVLVTKYRKQILKGAIVDDVKQKVYDICNSEGYWKHKIFWSDGYFACSIGEVSSATIQKYIESQG